MTIKRIMAVLILVALFFIIPRFGESTEGDRFKLAGTEFVDQEAFINSGRRCGTIHPDQIEAALIEDKVREFLSKRVTAQVTGGTINVYFHVMNRGTGIANGDVPLSQVNATFRFAQ